jgi:putative acetyltransferase
VSDRWRPELSLVAIDAAGAIVGHCVTSVGDLVGDDGVTRPILGLGPISVVPARQGEGIGAALLRATIVAAETGGWPVIVLVGHPTYYPRFGFERARPLGLEPQQDWPDEAWMALRLAAWTPDLRGTMRFPAAFGLD